MAKTVKIVSSAPVAGAIALLTSVKAIEAGITSIHTTGQTLQTLMHQVACSVLARLGKHGDVRILEKLMLAMPDMARKNSLIQWFETFGPVKYMTETKTFMHVSGKGMKLGDATAKPFWKFKANEGAEYEPMDIAKYVDQQIAKLVKDQEKTGADHSVLLNAMRHVKAGVKPVAAVQ